MQPLNTITVVVIIVTHKLTNMDGEMSSVDVIHGWRNVIHGWSNSSMDGDVSYMDVEISSMDEEMPSIDVIHG